MTESEILAVVEQLNRVEVKGETNLDTLLGCISFLKHKANILKSERLKQAQPEITFEAEGVRNNGR